VTDVRFTAKTGIPGTILLFSRIVDMGIYDWTMRVRPAIEAGPLNWSEDTPMRTIHAIMGEKNYEIRVIQG
jgi:hypothetical protein